MPWAESRPSARRQVTTDPDERRTMRIDACPLGGDLSKAYPVAHLDLLFRERPFSRPGGQSGGRQPLPRCRYGTSSAVCHRRVAHRWPCQQEDSVRTGVLARWFAVPQWCSYRTNRFPVTVLTTYASCPSTWWPINDVRTRNVSRIVGRQTHFPHCQPGGTPPKWSHWVCLRTPLSLIQLRSSSCQRLYEEGRSRSSRTGRSGHHGRRLEQSFGIGEGKRDQLKRVEDSNPSGSVL